jgi:hypothetical protein
MADPKWDDNVVDGMRHAVKCPFLQTRVQTDCDCHPLDDSKAMRSDDVLRIFAPLPPEEASI